VIRFIQKKTKGKKIRFADLEGGFGPGKFQVVDERFFFPACKPEISAGFDPERLVNQ